MAFCRPLWARGIPPSLKFRRVDSDDSEEQLTGMCNPHLNYALVFFHSEAVMQDTPVAQDQISLPPWRAA